MRRPSPGQSMVLIRTSPHTNRASLAWHNSMPSSSNSGTCANPMWGPSPSNIPYVNAWNAFCPNSLSCRGPRRSRPQQSGERSVRPLVIARKISGGTRSPKGSQTRMGLASLFGTWMAQHLNPFHQCLLPLPENFFRSKVNNIKATRTLRPKRKHDRMKSKSQGEQGMPRRGTAPSQKEEQEHSHLHSKSTTHHPHQHGGNWGTGHHGSPTASHHGEDLTAAEVFTVVAIMANTLRKRTKWSYFCLSGLEPQH